MTTPELSSHDRQPVPGVGVVIVDQQNRLLIVQRGQGAGAGLWAVPGGRIQWGETGRDAARREVREETGLDVEVGDVAWVGEAMGPGNPAAWHFTLVDYWGKVKGGNLKAGDDAADVRWVPLQEIRQYPLVPSMFSLLEKL